MKTILCLVVLLLSLSQAQAAMWVVLSNGEIWKYPQADYVQDGGPGNPKLWLQQKYLLYESSSCTLVRGFPKNGVKKVVYVKPKEAKKGYHVFWNWTGTFDHKAGEDYTEIRYHGVNMVVNNHSTFVPSDDVIGRGILSKADLNP
jgi:hypothetical protein